MSAPVSQSITQRSASNLALAFVLLPPEKRRAMATLYAFCREVDDVADETARPVAQRRADLDTWQADLDAIYAGRPARHAVMQELAPITGQYRLPKELFEDLIRGVGMDLEIDRYPDDATLDLYCYRVASVVGLLSIEIFGYRDPVCREYAVALGKALQLTNILRDVRTDAERGRIYLPLDALARFRVSEAEILGHRYSDRYRDLATAVAGRARDFYATAQRLLPAADRPAMVAAELMGSVYWRLLLKLERQAFDVFGPQPVRLSRPHKLALIFRTWCRFLVGSNSPAYGPA